MAAARIIGVIGAGTMGAGIAQLAARSGARTILHDPLPEALERGSRYARDGLAKEAAKGRLSAEQADAAAGRIEPVVDLAAFAELRGFAQRGGGFDVHNAAGAFLKGFGEGKFGRFTFERPAGSA